MLMTDEQFEGDHIVGDIVHEQRQHHLVNARKSRRSHYIHHHDHDLFYQERDREKHSPSLKGSSDESSDDSEDGVFQAGGHGKVQRYEQGKIRKKTTKEEINFYLSLNDGSNSIPDDIKDLCPSFYGHIKENRNRYLIIEDLTYNMEKPCIMDIKMGTETCGKDANFIKKKIVKDKDKSTTSRKTGIRIVGARIYNKALGNYQILSRSTGYELSAEELPAIIANFMYNGIEFHPEIVSFYIEKLVPLYEWMKVQTLFHFYSSSLLFVYDGASTEKTLKADVRMIDFAHVFSAKERAQDVGYHKGITSLLGYFENFQHFDTNKYTEYSREQNIEKYCIKGKSSITRENSPSSEKRVLRSSQKCVPSVDVNSQEEYKSPSSGMVLSEVFGMEGEKVKKKGKKITPQSTPDTPATESEVKLKKKSMRKSQSAKEKRNKKVKLVSPPLSSRQDQGKPVHENISHIRQNSKTCPSPRKLRLKDLDPRIIQSQTELGGTHFMHRQNSTNSINLSKLFHDHPRTHKKKHRSVPSSKPRTPQKTKKNLNDEINHNG